MGKFALLKFFHYTGFWIKFPFFAYTQCMKVVFEMLEKAQNCLDIMDSYHDIDRNCRDTLSKLILVGQSNFKTASYNYAWYIF